MSQEFSRRDFLRMAGLGTAGLGLAGSLEGCQSREQNSFSKTLPELVSQPETLGVARGSVLLGVMPFMEDVHASPLETRIQALNQRLAEWEGSYPRPQVVSLFEAMHKEQVSPKLLQYVLARGSLPMVNLYLQDKARPTSLFRFAEIGRHERYFRELARTWRQLQEPILCRFAYEMNLFPDPTNGYFPHYGIRPDNTPQDFIAAWRYVRRIFQEEGANNVLWVFAPNVVTPGQENILEACCPAPEEVDTVALDGYDRHPDLSEEVKTGLKAINWQAFDKREILNLGRTILKSASQAVFFPDLSFGALFGPSLKILKGKYPDKPLWLSEIGSSRQNRGLWLAQAIQEAVFQWGVKAIIFFEQNKEHLHWLLENDWKLADKPEVVSHLQPYLVQPAFCPTASLELIKPILEKQLNHELQ